MIASSVEADAKIPSRDWGMCSSVFHSTLYLGSMSCIKGCVKQIVKLKMESFKQKPTQDIFMSLLIDIEYTFWSPGPLNTQLFSIYLMSLAPNIENDPFVHQLGFDNVYRIRLVHTDSVWNQWPGHQGAVSFIECATTFVQEWSSVAQIGSWTEMQKETFWKCMVDMIHLGRVQNNNKKVIMITLGFESSLNAKSNHQYFWN